MKQKAKPTTRKWSRKVCGHIFAQNNKKTKREIKNMHRNIHLWGVVRCDRADGQTQWIWSNNDDEAGNGNFLEMLIERDNDITYAQQQLTLIPATCKYCVCVWRWMVKQIKADNANVHLVECEKESESFLFCVSMCVVVNPGPIIIKIDKNVVFKRENNGKKQRRQ